MFNIQKLGKNKELLRISLLVFSLLILIIFNSFSTAVNRNIESIFYSIKGSSTPDTNIVLIKITQNDIEKLGGWPLKRSYYALLLNKLKQFEAKKIGLEVFISSTKNSQNIYNDLIINELEKEQTVLSCYVNSILNDEGIFYADSIINPLTDLAQEYAEIGHINYLDLNDIYIPHKIVAEHDTLFSFSSLLCDGSLRQTSSNDFTKLNFYSSFNSFNSFSLIEFFDILENNSESLKSLKDKIILIGVADPSIGKSVKSHFDSDLPGIGMHAMAVDNLLNNSFLNPNYHAFSTVLFIVLILVLLLVVRKYQIYFYPILLFVFLIISYLFFHLSYIELNYTAFLLPIFLLFVLVWVTISYDLIYISQF